MTISRTGIGICALALGFALVACSGDDGATPAERATPTSDAPVIHPGDGGNYHASLDPSDFVDAIDNPYLPFAPGARWVYEGEADGETERIEVVVSNERRTVMGISATVVRDTVIIDGEVIEDTFDWYAQDRKGNVWYLGEETKEYEDGKVVSTAGSWEAGVDGALPGIAMKAAPEVGDAYRQEYYKGEAEDLAEVVRRGDTATVPFGRYEGLLVIEEWNPLDPDTVEEKSYASLIGLILEVKTAGGNERVELILFTPGR